MTPEVGCSVPAGRRTSRAPPPRPALWWRASARAIATDWRSCLSMARSRRSVLRLAAEVPTQPTSMASTVGATPGRLTMK